MNHWKLAMTAGIGLCVFASAASAVDYREEYDKKIKAAQNVGMLGDSLAGDQINFYTGATSFKATDIQLPGNYFTIELSRSYTVEYDHLLQEARGANTNDVVQSFHVKSFGDWELDVPYIGATLMQPTATVLPWQIDSTTPSNRCSVVGQVKSDGSAATGAPAIGGTLHPMGPALYWHGYTMNVPGGEQSLLKAAASNTQRPSTGGPYHWTTNKNWWVSCLPATANNKGGEGFLAVSPDGVKYTFDWLSWQNTSHASDSYTDIAGYYTWIRYSRTHRAEFRMLPTRVEDRFGNWMKYTWSNHDYARLVSISTGKAGTTAADQTLTVTYGSNGAIQSATDGTRTWTYDYEPFTTFTGNPVYFLSDVHLPDGTAWEYGFGGLFWLAPPEPYCDGDPTTQEWAYICFGRGAHDTQYYDAWVKHPSGARIDFVFADHFQFNSSGASSYPIGFKQKTISGPGMTPATWKMGHLPSKDEIREACFNVSVGCPPVLMTDMVSPDGGVTRQIFYHSGLQQTQVQGELHGALTAVAGTAPVTGSVRWGAYIDDPSPVSGTVPFFYAETDNNYVPDTQSMGYLVQVGDNPLVAADPVNTQAKASERRQPVQTRYSKQQGVTFVTDTTEFDAYANPNSVTRSSVGGAGGNFSRTETTAYAHDVAKWVIGQVESVTNAGTGEIVSRTEYDATTRLPWRTYSFELLQATMTYNTDGTLATVTDGRNNTISLSGWYRGIPGTIDYPTGASESATVNSQGWITGTTDELENSTVYGYDSLGRLTSIAYPSGDTTAWNPLGRSFAPVASSEYGIGAGHWKQTVQTGNGKTTTYYDALWRPVLVLTEDTGNAGSKSFVVTRYDVENRVTFQSYPVGSLTGVNDALAGTTTTYDALGRVYQVKQDSEQGVLTTTNEYLTGFITRVTNPRGYVTETKYQLFDSPSTEAPVEIITAKGQPEQQTTTIVRDGFGKPLSVTRSGAAP